MKKNDTELSKYISYILRHCPEEVGISLTNRRSLEKNGRRSLSLCSVLSCVCVICL